MPRKVKIPCDYKAPFLGGYHREDGSYLIYGEMGGPLPQVVECPKCHGTKLIEVDETFVFGKLEKLAKERDELEDEIEEWLGYLEQKASS
jgi:hypothetical protein